jgi:hypothetical protein
VSFLQADNIMPREAIEGLGVEKICARTDTPLDEFNQLDEEVRLGSREKGRRRQREWRKEEGAAA